MAINVRQSIPYLLLKECEPLFRSSPFSYVCGHCGHCCINTRIRLNAYEIERLAAFKGLSSTEFIERFTQDEGTEILSDDQGRCSFLVDNECSVYDARPLVCRIYPLCRKSQTSEGEAFRLLEPEAATAGKYGTAGTVNDYLNSQNAEEFIIAFDKDA